MKKVMTIDVEKMNISALFSEPTEKGSGEWRSADPVKDDIVSEFNVMLPKKALVLKERNHVLRIISVNKFRRAY